MDSRTLNAAERALSDAFPRGAVVDLTGRQRVAAHTVRAEVIAALLAGALPAEPGRIAAVRLTRAREHSHPLRSRLPSISALRGAVLSNLGGDALLAYGIQTGGSVTLSEGFRAEGAVRLSRSRIGGGIFLDHACLENPAGDVDGYHPRNYETLAAMYRNSGDDSSARRVLLAREREHRLTLPGTGGRGRGCRRSRSGTGTGRSARPPGCWRSSPSAPWSSGCIIRRRWPEFPIPPSIRSSTRLT